MSAYQRPTTAIVLSLLSGIFIMFFSIVCIFWWNWWPPMGIMPGMSQEWHEHMRWFGDAGTLGVFMGFLGIIFGVIVVAAAVMLYSAPRQHEMWGAIIIAFSVISIVSCMGGFGIGTLLGIIGGILATIWRPPRIEPQK